MNSDLIKNVLGSEDAGHDLLDAIDASVSAWLADAELDADELSEIRRLEAQARALIETDLIQHEHLGAGVDKILPGAPYLMLGWLQLTNLILLNEIKMHPFSVSNIAKTVIGTPGSVYAIKQLATFDDLPRYTTAMPLAALVYLGLLSDEDAQNDLLDVIANTEPVFGESVRDFALEMSDQLNAGVNPTRYLLPMPDYLEVLKEANPKSYSKHYRTVPQTLLDQGYVGSAWVTDQDLKSVHLLFAEETLSISHEKSGTRYLRADDVRGVVIGTATERIHTGFTHNDYHRWTVDIYTRSGSVHQFQATLSSGRGDPNPAREMLTKTFNTVGGYYPVTASGDHTVNESGFRTSMVYWH